MESWSLDESEIECTAIRAQGAGGQNVNKVSSAIHLRFDIKASSLPDIIKQRMLASNDQRITADGLVIIKAQTFRTQLKNREDAIQRLHDLIAKTSRVTPPRKATRPTLASKIKRVEGKTKLGRTKSLRGRPSAEE